MSDYLLNAVRKDQQTIEAARSIPWTISGPFTPPSNFQAVHVPTEAHLLALYKSLHSTFVRMYRGSRIKLAQSA